MKALILLILLTSSALPCWSQSYTVGGYHYPPFIYADATQGIYVDLMTELAAITQQEFNWEYYPYARLDALFTKARVHIEVGSSPIWTQSKKVPGFYTKSFYTLKDVAVFRRGEIRSLASFTDLKGLSVGMVRGYSFPQYQQAFDDGIAVRVDAANELALLNLLVKNRVDQIFISHDLFIYLKNNNKEFSFLRAGDVVGSYEVAIRVHPDYRSLVNVLDKGIDKLKEKGLIKAIINKHLSN